MQRRDFLALCAAASATASFPQFSFAEEPRDVAWLAEVQQPPQSTPPLDRPLASLLADPSRPPITNLQQWESARKHLRNTWLNFLGPMPTEPPPVKLEVLKEDRPDGCVRQLVRYLAEADEPVEGYLLRPSANSTAKRSGIVALHQTSNTSIEEIAGVNSAEQHHLGLQLCRDGHVVFCPRCYLWQTPPKYELDVKGPVEYFNKRHPQTLGMHKMLFDAQRGVDVLTSLPDVDPQRIGTVGHSLGAKEVLYLMAFDERVKAGVASEGGLGFSSTNWHDPWYLGAKIDKPGFRLNHHQLLALIAPRALLVLAGESGRGAADGDRSWPYIEAALPVYRLYGKSARLGMLNHHQGHTIPPDARAKLLEWLRVYT